MLLQPRPATATEDRDEHLRQATRHGCRRARRAGGRLRERPRPRSWTSSRPARGACSTSAARPAGSPRALKERGDGRGRRDRARARLRRRRARSAATASWSATSRRPGRPRPLRLPRRRRRARAPRRPVERARGLRRGCSSPAAARSSRCPTPPTGRPSPRSPAARWPRRPEGIHDATHLRWFTLRDAVELCEGAGPAGRARRAPPVAAVARHAPGPPRRARSRGCRRSRSSTCSPRDARRMARP